MTVVDELATLERAKRLANEAAWAISIQRERIAAESPFDGVPRRQIDYKFLILALWRLRRVSKLTERVAPDQASMNTAIAVFDGKLPDLKKMRDTLEHVDEYAVDCGRNESISRYSLECGVSGPHKFQWLDAEIDADEAERAARELFSEIMSQVAIGRK